MSGDPEELRTAVSNVLDNAVKYSGERVEISVRLETPDEKHGDAERARPRSGDSGGELKRIFKRFYRVSSRSLGQ